MTELERIIIEELCRNNALRMAQLYNAFDKRIPIYVLKDVLKIMIFERHTVSYIYEKQRKRYYCTWRGSLINESLEQ